MKRLIRAIIDAERRQKLSQSATRRSAAACSFLPDATSRTQWWNVSAHSSAHRVAGLQTLLVNLIIVTGLLEGCLGPARRSSDEPNDRGPEDAQRFTTVHDTSPKKGTTDFRARTRQPRRKTTAILVSCQCTGSAVARLGVDRPREIAKLGRIILRSYPRLAGELRPTGRRIFDRLSGSAHSDRPSPEVEATFSTG